MWRMDLDQRRVVVKTAIQRRKEFGAKYKKGAEEFVVAASLWAQTQKSFIDAVDRAMTDQEIPFGITMPWGITVRP